MPDIRYTKDHEWVSLDGAVATVGITDHAQEQLGELVFIELPEEGREVAAGDEVEAAWEWVDPIIAGWERRNDVPKLYDPGSSGPDDALMLLHRDGRRWRDIRG